jgi:hypothetical protein
MDKPCLTACPVGAFTPAGYNVPACVAHIAAPAGADCMTEGCRARRACPVGPQYRHIPAQAEFHQRAFLEAQRRPETLSLAEIDDLIPKLIDQYL